MAESDPPLIETCPACGALIDVSDAEPLALLHCPSCGGGMRVRKQFDHFELQEVLGAGGMGAVYRALDANLHRNVALKLLRKEYSANEEFVVQFQNEASITASINHPNVVKVYSSGNDHGLIYIAMELVDKGSLDDLMTLQGKIAEVQVLEVGAQIAAGLNAALQRGLIHRDIKPGNILFADAHTAKIVDFGLAVLQEHAGKIGGEVWGTPYYVAPEKLDNSPEDFRSDMYSLGATLFHAVAGRPPFEAETASMVALKHLKSQVVSLQAFAPEVSSATAFVINKTLNKDPAQRYQSYEELIEHLNYARSEVLKRQALGPHTRARLVLEDAGDQKTMSWITFGMVAVIVLGGVLAFTMRDRLFGPPDKPDVAAQQAQKAAVRLEPRYQDARQLLIKGQHKDAGAAFHALGEVAGVPQPLYNWITFHEGFALLLDGDEKNARTAFDGIMIRGKFSDDPAQRRLAQFFVEFSQAMTADKPVPASVARDYDKSNYWSIGLLLLALKDWHLGDFDNAGPLFRQFQSASPHAPDDWIAQYKDIAATYIGDYTVYRGVSDAFKGGATLDEQKRALGLLKTARGDLKLAGPLTVKFDAALKKLSADLGDIEARQAKEMSEQATADVPLLIELRQKLGALSRDYRFAEARALIAGAKLRGEKGQREQAALVRKMEWLIKFRAQLIGDLAPGGCTTPVSRKSGAAVPIGTVKATDARVEIWLPAGILPIPWADITSESLIAVAQSLIKPELDSAAAADRQWALGVFELTTGHKTDGEAHLATAAQARNEYKEALPQLLESDGGG